MSVQHLLHHEPPGGVDNNRIDLSIEIGERQPVDQPNEALPARNKGNSWTSLPTPETWRKPNQVGTVDEALRQGAGYWTRNGWYDPFVDNRPGF